LTGITATGLTWSASYNGDDARLRQLVNGVPTTYTLDLAAPLVTALAERTGATTKQYLYGQGDSPMAVYSGTTWTYLSGRDGLNSVRQETDASGNVLTARSFDPYGVPLDGNGGSPFGYTGEQTDVTGLLFLRARYMQPGLGMFLSRDPLLIESPYRYASGNPINRSDPSGYIDWPMCAYAIPYRICTTEQGDNIWEIARLINNAGIGLPGNDQAINVIKLANRFVRHRKPFDPSGLVARIAATRAERFDSA
jgi:RHS repeat-associated protein